VRPDAPPPGVTHRADLGLLVAAPIRATRLHRWATPFTFADAPPALWTPGGDLLLLMAAGERHYARQPATPLLITAYTYRSRDRGETWEGPTLARAIPYNHHAWVPLSTQNGRITVFGTELRPDRYDGGENAPIGLRHSDDDGYTWSEATLIEPTNDPGFAGMSMTRGCETDAGTWMIGSHTADWAHKPITTRQYILRSENRGGAWMLLPGARPDGWYAAGYDRMDEGRVLALGGGRVLFMTRTAEGHLWTARSDDDGRTWSAPRPTALVHPDAPPMVFTLADGTLAVFFHNRHTGGHFNHPDRSELWVSRSVDAGTTWDEPRFLAANTAQPADQPGNFRDSHLSYADLLTDGTNLHLFIPHQFRQILHLRFTADDLSRLPTRADLHRAPV